MSITTMATKPHFEADTTDIRKKEEDGTIEHILGPRAFNIVWGNDRRYWEIPSEKRSGAVTTLIRVNWLEVTSSVFVGKEKKCFISFKLSMKLNATGWKDSPVYLMAKVGKRGKYQMKKLTGLNHLTDRPADVPADGFSIDVHSDTTDNRLYFGLYEVWSGKWKGGLRIHSATVKEVKQQGTSA